MAAGHGIRGRYLQGCRCDDCRAANTAYERERKRQRAAPDPAAPAGRVELAVAAELEGLPLAQQRPGMVATALTLARLLGSPQAMAQHPAAAGKLSVILQGLHKGGGVRRPRLELVKAMSKQGTAPGTAG